MNDGRVLAKKDFPKAVNEEIAKVIADPDYIPAEYGTAGLTNVLRLEGTATDLNAFLRVMKTDLRVVGQPAAKGATVVEVGDKFKVNRNGVINVFDTQAQA